MLLQGTRQTLGAVQSKGRGKPLSPELYFVGSGVWQGGDGSLPGREGAGHYALYVILEGQGVLRDTRQGQILKAGDIFLLRPEEGAECRSLAERPLRCVWVAFDGESAGTYADYAGFVSESVFHSREAAETSEKLIEALSRLTERTSANELMRLGLLYELLYHLAAARYTSGRAAKNGGEYPPEVFVEYAKEYIAFCYAHIKVIDIVNYIGVTRSCLNAVFKSVLGTTPQEYLVSFKMKQAAEFLCSTSLPLSEIARQVGYQDAFAFSKMFKEKFRVSPSLYRQQMGEMVCGDFARPARSPSAETEGYMTKGIQLSRPSGYAGYQSLWRSPASNPDFHLTHVGDERCAPGHYYDKTRAEYHMHVILSGEGVFSTGGRVYPLARGDVFLIAKGESNYYQAGPADPWHYVWISFNGSRAREFLQLAGFGDDRPVRKAFAPPEEYAALVRDILETRNLTRANEILRMSKLYAFFSLLIRSRHYLAAGGHSPGVRPVSEIVGYMLQYIHTNYQTADVATLARHVGFNRSYLSTLFKKEMGISLQQYLIHHKIGKAAELLAATPKPIQEIAAAVGYDEPFNFSRAFRAVHGLSPRDYRKARAARAAPAGEPPALTKDAHTLTGG